MTSLDISCHNSNTSTLDSTMADKERLRLRTTFAELLSPATMSQTARGTITDHDEPVVGGSVKGQAGQEDNTTHRYTGKY